MPFTPNESGHVLAFIFGTFFLVTLFMTVIYAAYYDDRHIPRFIATIRNRRFSLQPADLTFARFDNRSSIMNLTTAMGGVSGCGEDNDENDNESVAEVDFHFGTDASIENINSAFNNPMFDQNIVDNDPKKTTKSFDEVELKED